METFKQKASAAALKAKESMIQVKSAAESATKRGSELLQEKATSVRVAREAETEEDSLLDELNEQCTLTRRQRLYGALSCYILGGVFSFLSTLFLFGGSRHLGQFAFVYTLGNLCSVGSSAFLVGPCRQFKVMCQPVRRIACIIWFTSMLATIVIAILFPHAGLLVLLLITIQYMAMFWYGATFIPYGRTMIKKVCQKVARQASSV